ncbi:MAG: 30S ribosomal protein S8e [Candidatus Bathyarchaeota archaeon]|nr:MAG: 30S ribosomal protein S8e [Candidatus Bathyarchaeota archaeon]
MSVWHGNQHKKKTSGGRKKAYRMKRNFEKGSFPAETTLGKLKKKNKRTHGGGNKPRLLGATHVNLSNLSTGKTEKVKILRVIKNPANVNYDRRGVITKGTIIETPSGTARVTSRPGQNGSVNAVPVSKKS